MPPLIQNLIDNVNIPFLPPIIGAYSHLRVGAFAVKLPQYPSLDGGEVLIANQLICKFNASNVDADVAKAINAFIQSIPSYDDLCVILRKSPTGQLRDVVERSKIKKVTLGCALMVHKASLVGKRYDRGRGNDK